jgi:ligand-binding sensor domain-containing protein
MRPKAIIYILAVLAILLGAALIFTTENYGELLRPAAPSPTNTRGSTASPSRTPTRRPTTSPTLTPSNTPTQTPTSAFASVADLVSIPAGGVNDLWVSAPGDLWVAAGNGLYRNTSGGAYQRISDQVFSHILGADDLGHLWAVSLDGGSILSYNGVRWTAYSAGQGWNPVQPQYLQEDLAVDAQGRIWLATGADDLRLFDPAVGRWTSLSAVDIGFTAADPAYQGHYLTDAVIAPDGSVWVADCEGQGEGFSGQGVRSLEAGTWKALDETAGQCVYDIRRDSLSRMWVGAFDEILRYNTISGAWTEIPLPDWGHRQIVLSIILDPAGSPWVGILRCGAASCNTLVYDFLQGGTWMPYLDETTDYTASPGLGFTPDGNAWICHQGNLYRRSGPEGYVLYGSMAMGSCQVAVDGAGTVWVGASSGPAAGLWQVKP